MSESTVLLEVLFKPESGPDSDMYVTTIGHSWGVSSSECIGIFQQLQHFEGSWDGRMNARLEVREREGWIIVFDLKEMVPPAKMFYRPVKVLEMNAWSFARIPEGEVRKWKTIEDVEVYVARCRR